MSMSELEDKNQLVRNYGKTKECIDISDLLFSTSNKHSKNWKNEKERKQHYAYQEMSSTLASLQRFHSKMSQKPPPPKNNNRESENGDVNGNVNGNGNYYGEHQIYGGGGSYKVTFAKDGKKHCRVVQPNKRGTKCVMYKGELIPISKLKQ
jgi:hypothetical protein